MMQQSSGVSLVFFLPTLIISYIYNIAVEPSLNVKMIE